MLFCTTTVTHIQPFSKIKLAASIEVSPFPQDAQRLGVFFTFKFQKEILGKEK